MFSHILYFILSRKSSIVIILSSIVFKSIFSGSSDASSSILASLNASIIFLIPILLPVEYLSNIGASVTLIVFISLFGGVMYLLRNMEKKPKDKKRDKKKKSE